MDLFTFLWSLLAADGCRSPQAAQKKQGQSEQKCEAQISGPAQPWLGAGSLGKLAAGDQDEHGQCGRRGDAETQDVAKVKQGSDVLWKGNDQEQCPQ